jgi:hypothetical protein
VFVYYLSVAKDIPFRKRFWEMTLISVSVAALSFGIGYLVKILLNVGGLELSARPKVLSLARLTVCREDRRQWLEVHVGDGPLHTFPRMPWTALSSGGEGEGTKVGANWEPVVNARCDRAK